MRTNRLYIDELGSPKPANNPNTFYIVLGVVMPDGLKDGAKIFAEHIKFKYWGDQFNYTNIIFHSTEIGSRSGPFKIFRGNDELYNDFIFNLLKLMRASGIVIFANVMNLQTANKNKLSSDEILKRSSRHIVKNYVLYLLASKSKGSIIVESATRLQNMYYLEAFERHLAPGGISEVKHTSVRDVLGSISFVTKENNDIEEQLADLFSYAVKCKFESEHGMAIYDDNSYEGKMISILNSKFFKAPTNTLDSKSKLYQQIDPYKVTN